MQKFTTFAEAVAARVNDFLPKGRRFANEKTSGHL